MVFSVRARENEISQRMGVRRRGRCVRGRAHLREDAIDHRRLGDDGVR